MKVRFSSMISMFCLFYAFSAVSSGQDQTQTSAPPAASATGGTTVPRLVSFSGVVSDGAANP